MPHISPLKTSRKLLATAVSVSLFSTTALLSNAVMTSVAHAQNEQSQTMSFDITAGSLAQALNQFSNQSGLFISGAAELTQGKTSQGLKGQLSVQQALQQLLQGSGLDYRINDNQTISLRRMSAAQSNQSAQMELEQLTITGENIQRNILDTNTSINLQTAEKIERSNDLNIQDVFKRSANVVSTGVGVQSFDFSIRGISTDGVGGAGQEGLASIIIDGTPVTRLQTARGITSLFDVERIEILRGPQSTSQGKNSLAGAVIVTTKDPEFEQDTRAKLGYGNNNTYQAAIANTGPINDDLAYRISFNHQHTDGFLDNEVRNEDDYAFSTSNTLRAKLLYAPEDSPLNVLFSHTLLRAEANNDIETYDPLNERFVSLNPYDSRMETDQDLTTLNVDYELSDIWSIESVTTYNSSNSDDRNNAYAVTMPTDEQVWRATSEQEEITQELRLNYDTEQLQAVVGLYYSDYEELALRNGVGIVGFQTPVGIQDVHVVFDNPTKIKSQALFGELDYQANADLTLTAGFRYEKLDYDLNSKGAITLLPSGYPFANLDLSGDKDQDVFLPKLGATYKLDENQRVGITYSEGYRPGGVDLDVFSGSVTNYDSEYTKNYELSYKGHFDHGLTVHSNLFFINWEDMQTPGSADIRSGTHNAGEAEAYGAELELNWEPNYNLDTYFNIGYANTEFTDFVISGGTDYAGHEFANAPKLTAAIGGYYSHNDWTYGAEVSYRDSYYDSIQNNFKADALTLVNVSASYQMRDFIIRGYVNNLFDEVNMIRSTTEVEGETQGMLTDPRLVGMQLLYNF